MCLNHKECQTIDELIEHLSHPSCATSSFINYACRDVLSRGETPPGFKEGFVYLLAKAPESQLSEEYVSQARRLLGVKYYEFEN